MQKREEIIDSFTTFLEKIKKDDEWDTSKILYWLMKKVKFVVSTEGKIRKTVFNQLNEAIGDIEEKLFNSNKELSADEIVNETFKYPEQLFNESDKYYEWMNEIESYYPSTIVRTIAKSGIDALECTDEEIYIQMCKSILLDELEKSQEELWEKYDEVDISYNERLLVVAYDVLNKNGYDYEDKINSIICISNVKH
ncbi:hypothetical protein ACNQ21_00380 [Mycoplasma sp. VS299A]|uniref:hypothetical protein n=1 Tax=unclassified Mycoplasma TaxID=2683645 RepID=UPI003AAAF51C